MLNTMVRSSLKHKMKFFSVNKSNNIDDIKCILIHADSPGLVVLVGGDGDTKDTYLELGKEISRDINKDLLLFSFREGRV